MYCLWNKLTHYKHTPFLSLMIRHFQSRLQEQIYAQATCSLYVVSSWLPPATKLGQGNIFRSVCQQFCPWGGMRGCLGGCVIALGGHAWFYLGSMCGFIRGGMCGFIQGGRVWFFQFFRIQWDMVNERVVRILLECILVWNIYLGTVWNSFGCLLDNNL